MSGRLSYLAGKAAEDRVAAHYADMGHVILSRRWRGRAGEIDLVVECGGEVIFIEVKQSRGHARAAEALRPRQMRRLYASAGDYLGHMPAGQNTPCRLDVALVDRAGRVEILPNAIAA